MLEVMDVNPDRRMSISATSLPSIHQLHPYLSPPTPKFPEPNQESSSFPEIPAASDPNSRETDDGDYETPPPKKKRRRQALSCTECKRRKIKCDRNQPCAPCTRRSEASKCVWHNVEQVDEYVSRAEYDELKARVQHLEMLVDGLTTHPTSNPAHYGLYGPPMMQPSYNGYQSEQSKKMRGADILPGRTSAPFPAGYPQSQYHHQRIPSGSSVASMTGSSSGIMTVDSTESREHPGHSRKHSQDDRDRER
ncbi:hypothetical protein C8J56DRAFT_876542 [Mycena floridula]|nr:hypothetical protein C8J56DRAFT_876542 [Mycena floridula]